MANCGQYYKCVTPANYKPLGAIALGIAAGSFLLGEILLNAFTGVVVPGLGLVSGILLIMAVWDLCAYLSGGKSICLQDDSCVIGRVAELIPVGSDKSGLEKMDDDFTFNLILSPHSPVETKEEIIMSDPNQGGFIEDQAAITGLGLGYAGVSVKFTKIDHDTEVLHCEVKGCRVHDECIALKISAVAGAIIASICTVPVVGWLACLIALAIWAVVSLIVAAIVWAASHSGDINDVLDPASGEIRAANPDTGEGGDVVLVRGDWSYDAGHTGWNEIHPVRYVLKLTDVIPQRFRDMAKASPDLVAEFKRLILDPWCFYVAEGQSPVVLKAQQEPANNWHVHPLIDGCSTPPQIN